MNQTREQGIMSENRSNRIIASRRTIIKGGAAVAGALAMPAIIGLSGRAARAQAKGKIVKVIPETDLKVVDPVWTTATVTSTHAYLVYDTLFSMTSKLEPKPQMIDKWDITDNGLTYTFRLRDGLGWHDGTPVTAKDCVASIRRWAARFGQAKIMMSRAEKLDVVDDKTFVLKFKEPFGPVLQTLANPIQVCFIMREQEAATDPFTQIKNIVGSGPFAFVQEEWTPGAKLVYRKNMDYKPRAEPCDAYSGGKVVKVDRVEWNVIPDPGVATSALIAGEVDYITNPVADNLKQMRTAGNITIGFLDPLGWQFHIRMNSLAKPFDNPKMRQAIQMLVISRQEAYLSATGQTGDLGKDCLAPFVCGSPNESQVGLDKFKKYDPAKVKALLKEAGYNNEPIVIMDPTDQSNLHYLALVLAEHLREVGVNVDLQSMDWATLVSRRPIKAPPGQDRGGWHIFPTAWPSGAMMDPVVNAPLDTSCDQGNWFGWPCDDELVKLRLAYLAARDEAERKKSVEAIQARYFDVAPYAYAGQYFPPIAYRKDRLKDVIGMISPVYWNMEKLV